jgi:hypothetical protein
MGRVRSENGYKVSRFNAAIHNVTAAGIMMSRGPERCPHRVSCNVIRNDELVSACRPGGECPAERAFYNAFIEDAAATFSFSRGWLAESDFKTTIHELAIVELQRQRLSALVAKEGFTRPKIHPISGLEYGVEESLSAGRYATTLDNRFRHRMSQLLVDPRSLSIDMAVLVNSEQREGC